MNTSSIVQKLWNYCNGPGCGQRRTRSPAREYTGTREKPRLTLRDAAHGLPAHRPLSRVLRYAALGHPVHRAAKPNVLHR